VLSAIVPAAAIGNLRASRMQIAVCRFAPVIAFSVGLAYDFSFRQTLRNTSGYSRLGIEGRRPGKRGRYSDVDRVHPGTNATLPRKRWGCTGKHSRRCSSGKSATAADARARRYAMWNPNTCRSTSEELAAPKWPEIPRCAELVTKSGATLL